MDSPRVLRSDVGREALSPGLERFLEAFARGRWQVDDGGYIRTPDGRCPLRAVASLAGVSGLSPLCGCVVEACSLTDREALRVLRAADWPTADPLRARMLAAVEGAGP